MLCPTIQRNRQGKTDHVQIDHNFNSADVDSAGFQLCGPMQRRHFGHEFRRLRPALCDPADTTTTVSISCNPKKSQIVTIQVSGGNSGTPAMRNLLNGSSVLVYNLFSNPSRSQIIGDGTSGSTTMTHNVDRTNPWDVTLYGRIPALQVIPPGSHTDSLVVTLLW